ncbi:MAG: hypothetical protein ABIO16_01880 [Nocardioides sp.]
MRRPAPTILAILAILVAVVLLTGCARTPGTEDVGSDSYHDLTTADGHHPAGPPPLTLRLPEGDVELEPWTFCFSNGSSHVCADGGPPDDVPVTHAEGPIAFTFPLKGWDFQAQFAPTGDDSRCRKLRTVAAVRDDETYTIPALGPAGSYDVTITGNGNGDDLVTSFRWLTASDSGTPAPAAGSVGFMGPLISPHDEVEAFGPSLYLSGLAKEPSKATAVLVLPDAPGAPEYPMDLVSDRCHDDGYLSFEAPAEPGTEADLPDLGAPPYRTEVRVRLDGTTYVGTGSWPDDLHPRASNNLVLTWEPALPTGL